MVLVSAPFDGSNFLTWRRSLIIALRAKIKLGFIDGRYIMPEKTSDTYETWIRVDSMVTSWILNAISKRISKAFLYKKSSRQLWLDLEERVSHANQSLHLWTGTCGFTRTTAEDDNLTKLVQFLMGLNDSYDSIRNQILVMDPFSSINNAYSMVLRVERHRLVNMQAANNSEGVALHTKWNENKGGHANDTCFKIYGVPEWYKSLKDQKRKDGGQARGYNIVMKELGKEKSLTLPKL
ncbi:UNVERIFIED_CONTAM: hypothetical protein Sangu_2727200 [Sesamum angustifolium]|uniref:Retrotransposon Copia-like N-terminal domain-containing protein n=1 Tax=Sesamum angustifolium TaxID=2727405 RepID=A0AAW2IX01_9LAMI